MTRLERIREWHRTYDWVPYYAGGGEIPAGGCFVIEHLGTEP